MSFGNQQATPKIPLGKTSEKPRSAERPLFSSACGPIKKSKSSHAY